ncbi:serpentine type 7TM GPCR chemoreceptor str domain-containing protein [Ditylenchus destructor]|nr:serpentine type 7TM GPCR chemoreceptor str domain-containing protein [Ditylenchus destructor]
MQGRFLSNAIQSNADKRTPSAGPGRNLIIYMEIIGVFDKGTHPYKRTPWPGPKGCSLIGVRQYANANAINEIHHVTETTMNTLSIVFNCYLLYLIKYHSTFGVKLYKYLLTIDAMLDLFLSVGAFLAQPVALVADGNTVVTSNGFFAGRSPVFDSLFVTFYLFTLHTNIVWIAVQFVYRYRLLCKNNSNPILASFLITSVATAYSLFALWIITGLCQVREEYQSIGREVLQSNSWSHAELQIVMGRHIGEWQMIVYVTLWVVTCSASIGIVVWCEQVIAKNFNQLSNMSQGSAQRMHKEFHYALLAMAICPLVTTTIPVLYFMIIIVLRFCPGLTSAIMTIFLSSITLFNPLTTIVCFRCYRRFTIRLLTCGRVCNIVKIQNISTTTSQGQNITTTGG